MEPIQDSASRKGNPVSRRDFVRKSSAAAGVFAIVGPGAVRGTAANSAVTIGLIGSGGRGSRVASYGHANSKGRVTALCDLFDDQIEQAKKRIEVENPKVYKDFEALLGSDVDAVIIATPPFEHPRMLAAAVDAKKHIYCEKPMGVDAAGCQAVIEASRRHDPKKCLSTGFQQRYGEVYLEAHKRIQQGNIGELIGARASWISGDPWRPKKYDDPKIHKLRNWFSYRDYSGDIIIEQDCHNFDVLHWFLDGLPTRAVGYGGTKYRTWLELMDHLSLSFEFPNGMYVNFEANQFTPPPFRRVGEEFTGTKGVIQVSRARMVEHRDPKEVETIESARDITIDAMDIFLDRVQTGNVENVGERSALSTMIAILGRTAIYEGREATWKGEFGS